MNVKDIQCNYWN